MKHEHLEEAGGLSFGAFFARWMRFRREDMLAMLSFPVGFWLLLLAVVLIAGTVEGTARSDRHWRAACGRVRWAAAAALAAACRWRSAGASPGDTAWPRCG